MLSVEYTELAEIASTPPAGFTELPTCPICLGEYKEGHAVRHWKDTQHWYSLDLRTQQIWDYVGDNYVHRLNQSKADGKLVEMNSPCMSHEAHCGTCECSEDSGISGALFNSKVEAIVDEYNRLLATQLETQRQYYESLLAEAKSKRESLIPETVEKAVASKMQDIQNELDICEEAKKAVADVNSKLIKNQEIMRKKFKEIEEREITSLRLRDATILDLEEQIRDLTVYIEAQKTLTNMTDSDGIKGGTVLPVSYQQSSPTNTRRHKKSSRRKN
ncbi:BRAP2 RING ZnF UBP domain-containing protein 1 [Citrus sinensis]|uniref:BRAP2 RING ZnF UBP domain-containing protein 1 n=1 Tax=Citrus sinensis TaxID=2711 RepID=A0ACB8NRU5_CITSI|nr:BRAP2 RING ZnF UBP domain-containing protein 1 [Citrus sinensis]KAH9800110.1 BRAP2 RING ZnF UBP domain-containing protein 1 [Citrus sinensis]